jgi:hypothetical protein
VPRKNGDYKALWRAGINRVVASQRDEEAWMEDASNAKRFDENRKSSFAAERFCW